MENKLSKWICNQLCEYQVIDKEYKDVYVYGLELILSFLITSSIILAVGILFRQTVPTLTFLITFVVIRKYTGGYHANSYIMCKLCTLISFGISVYFANVFPMPQYMFPILLIIGCLIILLFGPIENIHKPLTIQEKKKHKITALILFILWCVVGFVTSFLVPIISNTILYTLCIIIILMIIPLFERRKHYEKAR